MKTSWQPKQKIAANIQPKCNATVEKSGVDSVTTRTSQESHAVFETEKLSLLELYPKRHLLPSTKISVQLFPIDDSTHMALEKDGHHPYLELSLQVKKKISSVLKHLHKKWGSSSVAKGRLMLFPFMKIESLSNCLRWTLDDDNISAGDVYVAVGSPSVFRLRYGWFSTVAVDVCPDSGHAQKSCSFSKTNVDGKSEQIEVPVEDLNFRTVIDAHCTPAGDKISSILIDSTDKEAQMDNGLEKSSMFYADGLTNISIGDLLSEASLLEKLNVGDPKVERTNTPVQAQCPQPKNLLGTTILDAEETCHAFLVNNISRTTKDALGENADMEGCFLDGDSKSFKFPKTAENYNEGEVSGSGDDDKKWKPTQMISRVCDDERSLGLRGIRWSDSLGPFDLGLPCSSQKDDIAGGEDLPGNYFKS